MRTDLPVLRTACVRGTGRFSGVSVLVAEEERGFADDFFGTVSGRGLNGKIGCPYRCRLSFIAIGFGLRDAVERSARLSIAGSCARGTADGASKTGLSARKVRPEGAAPSSGRYFGSRRRCRRAVSCWGTSRVVVGVVGPSSCRGTSGVVVGVVELSRTGGLRGDRGWGIGCGV